MLEMNIDKCTGNFKFDTQVHSEASAGLSVGFLFNIFQNGFD